MSTLTLKKWLRETLSLTLMILKTRLQSKFFQLYRLRLKSRNMMINQNLLMILYLTEEEVFMLLERGLRTSTHKRICLLSTVLGLPRSELQSQVLSSLRELPVGLPEITTWWWRVSQHQDRTLSKEFRTSLLLVLTLRDRLLLVPRDLLANQNQGLNLNQRKRGLRRRTFSLNSSLWLTKDETSLNLLKSQGRSKKKLSCD